MSEKKLAFIVDKSEAYVSFQKERILNNWQVEKADTQYIDHLSASGGMTLFGDAPTSLLRLEDIAAVKKLVEDLSSLTSDELEETFAAGLIVYTTVPRTGTKKLEEAFKKLGALMYAPPSKGDLSLQQKLVSELNLTKSVKDMLLAQAGDDYDQLLPLVDSIAKLPWESHRRITEEDIFARFTQEKGSVAPWLIEKPLFAGNVQEMIDILRRIDHHSSFLVPLTILRGKLELSYRVAVLLEANPRLTDGDIVKLLDVNSPFQVKLARGYGKTYGKEVLQKAVVALAKADGKVKGGSAAPSLAIMEAALVEVSLILKKRT